MLAARGDCYEVASKAPAPFMVAFRWQTSRSHRCRVNTAAKGKLATALIELPLWGG